MRNTSWNTVSPKKIGLGYRCTILHSRGPICATQDMLSLMYFRELYQTKQNKALDGPKSPERLVFTKPPHKTLVLSMSTKGIRTLAAPPSHTEQWQGFFFKGQGLLLFLFLQHNTRNKTKKKAGYFNAIFTFGSKYTRQTADVDLGREGIEVFHSDWAPFHWVSPGRKRQVHHRS